MKINFKYQDVEYSLEDCEPSWKIEELIKKIKAKLKAKGKSVEDVELTFDGKTLKTEDTIEKAGLSDGCTVNVTSQQTSGVDENEPSKHSDSEQEEDTKGPTVNEPSEHRKVKISIKKPDGKKYHMDVELSCTQDDFKQEVATLIDIHVGQLVLIYNSKELMGKKTLKDANIKEGSTVSATARVRGGGSNQ